AGGVSRPPESAPPAPDAHRAFGIARNVLAGGAEHQAAEAAVTAGADDEQVSALRLLNEHFGWVALFDARSYDHRWVAAQHVLDLGDQLVGGALAGVGDLMLRHGDAARRRRQRVLPDVEHHQLGPVLGRLGSRPRQRFAAPRGPSTADTARLP